MNSLDQQLDKLLKAASKAPAPPVTRPHHPSPRWLLQQRQDQLQLAQNPYPILRHALAAACILLIIATLLNLHQIAESKRDVFNAANLVLTQILTP